MRRALLLLALAPLLMPRVLFGQATRTWVSGVGDDANPCSRIAPCRSFAGAISKTASGGEIDCLDAGGFSPVTITKSLTIDGSSQRGGITAAGVTGVTVNGAGITVVLRGLTIEGTGTGVNGIQFLAGKVLHVERSVIQGFTGSGIDFEPAAGGQLEVHDTTISNVGLAGVLVRSGAAATPSVVSLEHVTATLADIGILVKENATVTAFHSDASHNCSAGFLVAPDTTDSSQLLIEESMISGNDVGVAAYGPYPPGQATVYLAKSIVTDNTGIATRATGNGSVVSSMNNNMSGNGTAYVPSGPIVTPPAPVTVVQTLCQ